MKTLRNKVILSAVVLAFALIATIGSTYAWFTVAQNVTVSEMTLNVTAADSLLVKVYVQDETTASVDVQDIQKYKTTLTNADIIAAYAGLLSYQLQPVTSIQDDYATSDPQLLNYLSNLTSYDRPLLSAEAGKNSTTAGKFVELSFWLYSQADTTKDIVLNSFTITASNTDSEKDAIANAVRLAIWEDGQSDSLIYGNDIDLSFAFTSGLPGYSDSLTHDDTDFNALSETTFGLSEITGTAAADGSVILSLASETPTLVTVRIYVEGWDADTTNSVVMSEFQIAWVFGYYTA